MCLKCLFVQIWQALRKTLYSRNEKGYYRLIQAITSSHNILLRILWTKCLGNYKIMRVYLVSILPRFTATSRFWAMFQSHCVVLTHYRHELTLHPDPKCTNIVLNRPDWHIVFDKILNNTISPYFLFSTIP